MGAGCSSPMVRIKRARPIPFTPILAARFQLSSSIAPVKSESENFLRRCASRSKIQNTPRVSCSRIDDPGRAATSMLARGHRPAYRLAKSVASNARRPFSHSPMRTNRFLFLVCAASALALINLPATEPAPATPKKPASNDYQGTAVEDPYQWLEKDDEPDVKAWANAQNQR